ncbi:MAG: cytochrome-c peroxidase [Myxococcales bacterium]|nr:cytochrome-c peroxidase [Myxococcales bacterium]
MRNWGARAGISAWLVAMTVGCGVTVEEFEPEPAESDVSMALLVGSEQVPSPFEIVPGIGRRLELPLGMRASGLELRSADRLDPSLIELGNLLFFDQRLSKGAVMSCATCHDPAHGYSTTGFTRGVGGNRLPRTTPPAMNRAFGKRATWSGKRTLEEQSTAPITSAAEMGLTEAELVATVTAIPGYADRFERLVVTGVLTAPAISVENIQQAIATFQRGGLMTGARPSIGSKRAKARRSPSPRSEGACCSRPRRAACCATAARTTPTRASTTSCR